MIFKKAEDQDIFMEMFTAFDKFFDESNKLIQEINSNDFFQAAAHFSILSKYVFAQINKKMRKEKKVLDADELQTYLIELIKKSLKDKDEKTRDNICKKITEIFELYSSHKEQLGDYPKFCFFITASHCALKMHLFPDEEKEEEDIKSARRYAETFDLFKRPSSIKEGYALKNTYTLSRWNEIRKLSDLLECMLPAKKFLPKLLGKSILAFKYTVEEYQSIEDPLLNKIISALDSFSSLSKNKIEEPGDVINYLIALQSAVASSREITTQFPEKAVESQRVEKQLIALIHSPELQQLIENNFPGNPEESNPGAELLAKMKSQYPRAMPSKKFCAVIMMSALTAPASIVAAAYVTTAGLSSAAIQNAFIAGAIPALKCSFPVSCVILGGLTSVVSLITAVGIYQLWTRGYKNTACVFGLAMTGFSVGSFIASTALISALATTPPGFIIAGCMAAGFLIGLAIVVTVALYTKSQKKQGSVSDKYASKEKEDTVFFNP